MSFTMELTIIDELLICLVEDPKRADGDARRRQHADDNEQLRRVSDALRF